MGRTRDRVAEIFYQRCFYRFLALVTLIVIAPFLIELPHGRLASSATQAFVLVAAAAAVSRLLPVFMLTTLLAGIAVWCTLFGDDPGTSPNLSRAPFRTLLPHL